MRRRAATSLLQWAAAREVGGLKVGVNLACSIFRTIRRCPVVKPQGNPQARKARRIASPPRVFSTS
jgi:hypothetical protein